ncbi:Bgt-2034 [Blumeria graminis f. sp. tritici]|uniref:alpha-galactosidase n=2 Tax=Blumeria graminis f. sp. tritici TaxID=62690 RepID=A0A381L2S4_BLUGR|nr:hypothetical protein BGT96224_2034 [Blumeria graminis f. sp. tritici 96224]VCU40187.1 Bgt-2034 [Blumeria graminis f. sp. tritici]
MKLPQSFGCPGKEWLLIATICLVTASILGVGLGVGLGRSHSYHSAPNSSTFTTPGSFWRPVVGTHWQIVLNHTLANQGYDVPIYDIDLFLTSAKAIAHLHAARRRVICYFSAGSYEPFRPDSDKFENRDKGLALDGWPDEYWLDTRSLNVRSVMKARLALAAQIGCDGVDPDNIDGYDNATGFDLTAADAIDFIKFLANEAHFHNVSIGLKNAGALVPFVLRLMEWEVTEQCVQYDECQMFRPFVDVDKPVFHIEYANDLATQRTAVCRDEKARGFSTVLKDISLDSRVVRC